MSNTYCMFKGKLKTAAPYFDAYGSSPHYIIRSENDGAEFNVVVNAASTVTAANNDSRVYSYIDPHFVDPICGKLKDLAAGLYTTGFPRLDYYQDRSLLDLRRMRLVPYEDADGTRFDINDQIDQLLTVDRSQEPQILPFDNGHTVQDRKFWSPTSEVIVYGFGFLFQPKQDGLHETHMNQGNPRSGGHARENGVFQDGAVIVQIGDDFAAMFTAFQSQFLPTNANGFPVQGAVPLAVFIAQ